MATLKRIKLSDIKTDPIGDMLVNSDAIKPYIAHYQALMTGGNSNETLAALAALPVERRYLSRVEQCLDWAFADFDDETAKLDMPYMPALSALEEKLELRLWQLDSLLKTVRGR